MESEAWRFSTPAERSCLLEVAALYNGTNNGHLAMSVRRLSELANVNKDTAGRCLKSLEAKGLIELVADAAYLPREPGEGGLRRAAEWRLTWCRCNRSNQLPSRAYKNWSRTKKTEACPPVPDIVSPGSGQTTLEAVVSVPSFRTERAA